MGCCIVLFLFAVTIPNYLFAQNPLDDLTANITLNESPKGTLKECWSIYRTATDQWCNENCLKTPPFCPAQFCKCGEYSFCFANNTTPYRRFGTSTSYLLNANLDDTEITVPGCKPVMLFFIVRHGTRGAHMLETELMNKLVPGTKQAILQAWADGKSKLCHKDIINLENWSLVYTPEKHELVGEAGKKEMRELGQKTGNRFPKLLKNSQKTVRRTTPEQRTHVSMEAFLMGMYGHQVDYENSTEAMFTFDKQCAAFQVGVDLKKGANVELNKLMESSAYKRMVAEISDRVGVQLNWTQVDLAWRICKYDSGNFPDSLSPWCALFSENNLRLIDYSDNLVHYYKFPYYDITRQMTQPLMTDLHQKFSSLKSGNENIPALYVVHSRVAHSMVAALELYIDDKPPLASDWPNPHTKWSTSTMLSFGHNLALVALQCEDPQDQFKVLAMHQERRISLSGICGEEICPLQTFLDKIQPFVDTDFEKVCEWHDGCEWHHNEKVCQ